jgi:integrase
VILDFFKPHRYLHEILYEDVEKFVVYLKKEIKPIKGKKIQGTTVNKYLALLRVIYNRAIKSKIYNGSNPVQIKFFDQITEEEPYELQEIRAILKEARLISDNPETINDRDFFTFLLLISISVRPADIFVMMKSDIRPNYILIRGRERSKTKRTRKISISPLIFQLLEKYVKGIMVIETTCRRSTAFRRQWNRVKQRLGITGKMYNCRHTFGTMIYDETKDLLVSQESMGHRETESTKRYIGTSKDSIRAASIKVQEKLLDDGKIIPLERKA